MKRVLLILLLASCANPDAQFAAMEKTIRALEARVVRAEAKNAELNDRVFVVSARVDECRAPEPSAAPAVAELPADFEDPTLPEHLRLVSGAGVDESYEAPVELTLHGDGPTVDVTDLPPVPRLPDPSLAQRVFDDGLEAYRRGEFTPARDAFQSFVDSNPVDGRADNALFWVGQCSYELGDFSDALTAFRRIVNEYPKSKKVPDALFKIGTSYERLSDDRNARRTFETLVKRYPQSAYAELARARLK
ncbi:MAG: tol-pal system protein YbgF [Myxococcota bacterium]